MVRLPRLKVIRKSSLVIDSRLRSIPCRISFEVLLAWGTGERVGRGGRGKGPREGNDERVDDLNSQDREPNRGALGLLDDTISQTIAEPLTRHVGSGQNRGNVGNKNGNVVNENVQENIWNVIVNGNQIGCSYKEFLACNPKEYDGKGGVVVLTRRIEKMESVQDMSGCSIDQKVKYTASSFVKEFCPGHEMQKLETELWNHAMVGAGHAAYTDRFHELARLVPHLVTPESRMIESTFEVGQGSGSAPESERPERVSAFRQPTLTTWTDPEDGMIYIDIPDYPPPAPPVQTPPSPEWTSGSLPISPSHSDVPSPVSSPIIPLTVPSPVATPTTVEAEGFLTELGAQVEMQGGLIRDHAVRLEELSPALFERYDRDIGELFIRSGAVREEIFSQRYRFRSLEYEQERVAVTFRAIWRPVLALEAWAGQMDAQRAALWHAISDVQGENRDLRLQLAEERRARLELTEVVDGMRRGQEPRGGA
ncbi:hypothetical protein Tco_1263655 [Tanacetum coccineum]